MSNATLALILFIAILTGLAVFYAALGKLSFWKLVARFPEQALEYISHDPAWVVLQESDPAPGAGFTGPFLLVVPNVGRALRLYAREDQIEASQQRFVEMLRHLLPPRKFPFLSLLALLYPVIAMLSMDRTPGDIYFILGYGFASLGYLLGAATVVPGHFRVLGLEGRAPTLVAALVFWVVGVVLSNLTA